MLALPAHSKGLELACRVAPDVPEQLVGDAERLRQVLVNLVGNAIKFTERGEVASTCRWRTTASARPASCSRFAVRDTGIGIAEDEAGAVFEAFAQADGSTTRASTAAPAWAWPSPAAWSS